MSIDCFLFTHFHFLFHFGYAVAYITYVLFICLCICHFLLTDIPAQCKIITASANRMMRDHRFETEHKNLKTQKEYAIFVLGLLGHL